MLNKIKKRAIKTITTSAVIFVIMAIVGVIYSFGTHRVFVLRHIFDAGILGGAFLVVLGIYYLVKPVFHGKDKLVDHTTHSARTWDVKEVNKADSAEYILIGIGTILIAGILQIVAYAVDLI